MKSCADRATTPKIRTRLDSPQNQRLGASLTQKRVNNFAFNNSKVTRSTVYMNTIIEERKARLKNAMKKTKENSVSPDRFETAIPLPDTPVAPVEDSFEHLKKEYFKIVSYLLNYTT